MVVASIIVAVPRSGAVTTIAGAVLGQLGAAGAVGSFGLFGSPRIAFGPERVLGIVPVFAWFPLARSH